MPFRPASGLPPVRRAPRAKSKSRNQLQAVKAKSRITSPHAALQIDLNSAVCIPQYSLVILANQINEGCRPVTTMMVPISLLQLVLRFLFSIPTIIPGVYRISPNAW